jgi:riboflavin transport system permease protein
MKSLMRKKGPFLIFMMLCAYLLSAVIILLTFHSSPLIGLRSLFLSPFATPMALGNWLNRAVLFMISGTAVVYAFQGGEFNLGGEGQICLGGMITVIFFSYMNRLWGPAGILAALVLAAFFSGLLGSLSGFIKNATGLSEVITTYLLSMGTIHVSRYFITGPLKDSKSYLVTTPEIPPRFQLPELLSPSHLNISLFFAALLVMGTWLFLYYRPAGYDWRLCGVNGDFAAYCGVDRRKQTIKTLFVSGAVNGSAGAILIMGTSHRGIQDFFSGYGWNGMAVSLIGGNNPLLTIPSALFFSHLVQGAERLNLMGQFTYPLDGFIMAFIFLVVTSGRLHRD